MLTKLKKCWQNVKTNVNKSWKNVYKHQLIRGGIKIENRENLGQCPNRGGRGKKNPEMSQFQFGNFENRRGGLYFSRMSQFQFGNFENRRGGSLFFKNVPISIWEFWKQRGGVSIFQKCPNFNYLIVYFAILPL